MRVWLKNEKGVEVISLTDARLKEALALMRDSYYPDESAAKGVELHVRKFDYHFKYFIQILPKSIQISL